MSTSAQSLDWPLKVGATYSQEFFTPPNSMNILQMLKSPMVLMVLFSGIMAVAMPKLTVSRSDERRGVAGGEWRGMTYG